MSKFMWMLGVVAVLALGLMAYVRLAPTKPADWHLDLTARPPAMAALSPDRVTVLTGGAYCDLLHGSLARLDAIAMATPRTRRLAGSLAEGRITWETRSLFWGFPDYTTAQVQGEGLVIFARLRFGSSDLGVNARRLRQWIAQL
ncbi:DUF1499 domain-containing protein [Cypionkella sp.]|uniref:DUF1499 domain-containing protein n=1 Tax=Cypionkella sp. TaxID=2811411 RepID=UPI00375320C4